MMDNRLNHSVNELCCHRCHVRATAGHKENIPVTDEDLLLLNDEDEDTEEYNWYNKPPAEDFGNLDID